MAFFDFDNYGQTSTKFRLTKFGSFAKYPETLRATTKGGTNLNFIKNKEYAQRSPDSRFKSFFPAFFIGAVRLKIGKGICLA